MSSVAHRGYVHVGMDVSKDAIAVAVLPPDRDVAEVDKIFHDEESVRRLIKRLGRPSGLWACYEAGPTGYGLHRLLASMRVRCDVVAPSLIPKGSGHLVKTDRRDARRLAGLHRAPVSSLLSPSRLRRRKRCATCVAPRATGGGPHPVGSGFTFSGSILPAVVVGGLTAFVLQEYLLAKLGRIQGHASLHPTASVRLTLPPHEAFDRCLETVRGLPGAEVRRCDRTSGVLVATVGRSRMKLGDSLRLELRDCDAQTEVAVASRPRQPFTLLDYGRNDRLVGTVVALLTTSRPQ